MTAFSDSQTRMGWPMQFLALECRQGPLHGHVNVGGITPLQIFSVPDGMALTCPDLPVFCSKLPTGMRDTSSHAGASCCLMKVRPFGIHTGTSAVRCTSPRLVTSSVMSDNAAKLATLYAGFKGQFSNVKPITAGQLHEELHGPHGQSTILIDVRTPHEWEVSRLPGNVLSTDAFENVRSKTAKTTPLVTYW